MDDALLVCFMNRGTDLIEDVSNPLERQALLFCEDVAERAAVEILHHEVNGTHPALSEQVFEAVLRVKHLTNVFFRPRHNSHAENGLYYGSGAKSVSNPPVTTVVVSPGPPVHT